MNKFLNVGELFFKREAEVAQDKLKGLESDKTSATSEDVKVAHLTDDDENRDDIEHNDGEASCSRSMSMSSSGYTTDDYTAGQSRYSEDDTTYFSRRMRSDDDTAFLTRETSFTGRSTFTGITNFTEGTSFTEGSDTSDTAFLTNDPSLVKASQGSSSSYSAQSRSLLSMLLLDPTCRIGRNQAIYLSESLNEDSELRDDEGHVIQIEDVEKVELGSIRKDQTSLQRNGTMTEMGQEVAIVAPPKVFRSQHTSSTVESDAKTKKANNMAIHLAGRSRSSHTAISGGASAMGSDGSRTRASSSSAGTKMASNTKRTSASGKPPQKAGSAAAIEDSKKPQLDPPKGRVFFKIPLSKHEGATQTQKSRKFHSISPRSLQRKNRSPKLGDARMNYIASRRMKPIQSRTAHAMPIANTSANVQSANGPAQKQESRPPNQFSSIRLGKAEEESYDGSSPLDEIAVTESIAASELLSCDASYDGKRRATSPITCDMSAVTSEAAMPRTKFCVPVRGLNDKRNMVEKAVDVTYEAVKFCCAGTVGNSFDDLTKNDLVQESDEQATTDQTSGVSKSVKTDIASLFTSKFGACGANRGIIMVGQKTPDESSGERKREEMDIASLFTEKLGACGADQGVIMVGSDENIPLDISNTGLGGQQSPVKSPKRFSLRLPSSSLNLPSRAFMRIRSRRQDYKNGDDAIHNDHIPNEDDFMADILNEIKMEQEKQNNITTGATLPMVMEEEGIDGATDASRDGEQSLPQTFSDLIASAIAEEAVLNCIDVAKDGANVKR